MPTIYFLKIITFSEIDEKSEQGKAMLAAIREEAPDTLGYFFAPSELFHVIAQAGANGEFILDDVRDVLMILNKAR